MLVLDSGTRTGTESFARNRNQKFENSPYLEPKGTWRFLKYDWIAIITLFLVKLANW